MKKENEISCYVKIEDEAQRKDAYKQLQNLPYKKSLKNFIDLHKVIILKKGTIKTAIAFKDDTFIDCGTNIEMFLALASMGNDTDVKEIIEHFKTKEK